MKKKLTNALLLLGIIALLLIYFITVVDLPGRIYSSAQREYLAYNMKLSVAQSAPSMNLVTEEGADGLPVLLTLIPSGESRVQATLNARYEEQQGLSVTVYDLEFQGHYVLNGSAIPTATVELFFPFPSNLETLHEVSFTVDGKEPPDANYTTRGISWRTTLLTGETHNLDIGYKANGANSFSYGLYKDQRSQIDVVVTVTGLNGSSVPRSSLPVTEQTSDAASEVFTWKYTGLIANRDIQLSLPIRLSFAQRIAQLQDDFLALAGLAPVLVGLFIVCLAGMFSLSRTRFHLEGYLLAGLGLALFYPFLTFMSGIIGIVPAAIIALVVISALILMFFNLALGWTQTWRPLGILLIVFLGFFSIGMLTTWRGLSLTSGGLILIGFFMWLYAHRLKVPSPAPDLPSESPPAPPVSAVEPQPVPTINPAESPAVSNKAYCFHCGWALEETFNFCPGCGQDARMVQRCENCDHLQPVPPTTEPVYCVHCGHRLSNR